MGATKSVTIESTDPAVVAQQVRDALGAMPDCAVEASGAQFSVQMAIRVRPPPPTPSPLSALSRV